MCWGDHIDDNVDYGCYCTFKTRRAALDYAVDTVLERAENLEAGLVSNDDWKTEVGRDYVLDRLGGHGEFTIPLSFEEWPGCEDRSVTEYACIGVQEITHYER